MELYPELYKARNITGILFLLLCLPFTACKKAGCNDCVYQKQEFCKALMQVNCNSVYLTDNIDYLIKACGNNDATSFISTTTQNCTQGNLTCPQCE
jgi:hypothetical protein